MVQVTWLLLTNHTGSFHFAIAMLKFVYNVEMAISNANVQVSVNLAHCHNTFLPY